MNIEIREKLIADAKKYQEMGEDFKVWINELGWQDWMNYYTDAAEGEPISESEVKEIDDILKEIWRDAKIK